RTATLRRNPTQKQRAKHPKETFPGCRCRKPSCMEWGYRGIYQRGREIARLTMARRLRAETGRKPGRGKPNTSTRRNTHEPQLLHAHAHRVCVLQGRQAPPSDAWRLHYAARRRPLPALRTRVHPRRSVVGRGTELRIGNLPHLWVQRAQRIRRRDRARIPRPAQHARLTRPGGARSKPPARAVAGSQNTTQGGREIMRVRAKTFKNWMKANFTKGELRELAQHGAEAGWHGLTYYSETTKLYRRFADEIWEALIEDAREHGYQNVFEFIATFRRAD